MVIGPVGFAEATGAGVARAGIVEVISRIVLCADGFARED
jgi:hypothetical protein